MNSPILFHIPMTGKVDRENHIIKGVSLITGDLEAKGHSLHVDDTTTDQILKCAKAKGKITVKADHKGADGKTFSSIVGYVTNFSKEGKKVRGDLHLLESETMTPKIEEMAEVMPQNFGLSVAFKGPQTGEKVSGKNFARCEELQSVDLVENPAANPDGMFSAVDTGSNATMQTNNATQTGAQSGPVTLESLAALITQQNTAIAALTEQVAAQEQFLQNGNPANQPDLAELGNLSDAELKAAGWDVDQIRAAVEAAIASGELTVEGGSEAGATGTESGAAGVEAGAAPMAAALSALQSEIRELSAARNRDIRLAAKNEEEHAFTVLNNKLEGVIAFAEKLGTENKTLISENEALRVAIKTGHSFAGAVTDDGINLFNAKDDKSGQFEKIVTQKFSEFSQGGKVIEATARAQAIKFAVRNHPLAYAEYRTRGGAINLQAK